MEGMDDKNSEGVAEEPITVSMDENGPAAEQASEWKMPDPVYRQTSGKLAQSFEQKARGAAAAAVTGPLDEPAPAAEAVETPKAPDPPSADAAPQPDISDAVIPEQEVPAAPADNEEKGGGVRFVLIGLAILIVAAVAAAFLVFLWFFYLAQPEGVQAPF